MGFKCPLCNKDFGNSKEKFETHAKQCNFGMAAEFISAVKKTCEKKTEGGNIAGIDTRKPI